MWNSKQTAEDSTQRGSGIVMELETISKWCTAVDCHNSGKYREAVEIYCDIRDISARMYYNLACAYVKLNSIEYAIQCLSSAIQGDEHLVIAYFQRGTLYLRCNSTGEAVVDLETARTLLRGNSHIDYKPLGLYVQLNSFQIQHNLALAYAFNKRVADARKMLTEAIHDADEPQRRSLQSSLQRINENRQDLISPMEISYDKVFTPPKHVTQNLEKKEITRKAKVVSSTDTGDRSPAFAGSKRVKELKEMPTPQKSTLDAFNFLAVNKPRRNRSNPNIAELAEEAGMKKSKSMSDILTGVGPNTALGSKSPVTIIKRIFRKKKSDSTEREIDTEKRRNRPHSDQLKPLSATVGSDGRTSPRSALTGIRKLINNKRKGRNASDTSSNGNMPVLVMRGFGSTGDLRTTGRSASDSEGDTSQSPKYLSKSSSDFYEKLDFDLSGDRKSLGSVFGDYLTVTRQNLSLSCDVLTAIVTPTENEIDRSDDGQLLDSGKCIHEPEKEIVTQSSWLEKRLVDKTKVPLPTKLGKDKKGTKSRGFNSNANRRDHTSDTDTKKTRPPPPSYPPPPLPPSIVINS